MLPTTCAPPANVDKAPPATDILPVKAPKFINLLIPFISAILALVRATGMFLYVSVKSEYPDNIFVDELPDFNKYGIKAYKELEETGMHMLRAIALYLGLDEFFFDDKIKNGNSILRPIHYPPITHEPESAVRAAEHEDINLITLLMGASAEGLEVLNKQGEWVGITALPEQLVVNVGDMLQRLTNNKLKSTTHRVVNPPREQWANPRFSIPFFLHPRSDMRLDCLESCVTSDYQRHYEPISAGEYLNERLREIGLRK